MNNCMDKIERKRKSVNRFNEKKYKFLMNLYSNFHRNKFNPKISILNRMSFIKIALEKVKDFLFNKKEIKIHNTGGLLKI